MEFADPPSQSRMIYPAVLRNGIERNVGPSGKNFFDCLGLKFVTVLHVSCPPFFNYQKFKFLIIENSKIATTCLTSRGNGSLRGAEKINRRVGRDVGKRKVEKHFEIAVTDSDMSWRRNEGKIRAEAVLDGIYIVRTSLGESDMGAEQAVSAYGSLSRVERAFRSIKTTCLEVRPIYVYSENHVRGHVFLCVLAYYLEWHLRRGLAPLMFEDDDRDGAKKKRSSPVEKARVSNSAKRKSRTKKTGEGFCVHSFGTLMEDLATLSLNEVTLPGSPEHRFPMITEPTPLQSRAFELLDVEPGRFVASKLTG